MSRRHGQNGYIYKVQFSLFLSGQYALVRLFDRRKYDGSCPNMDFGLSQAMKFLQTPLILEVYFARNIPICFFGYPP